MSDYTEPGIYSALDSTYGGGMHIGDFPVPNQQALQDAVNAAVAAGGGVVLIPATDASDASGAYQIECPSDSSAAIVIPSGDMMQPLLICGTGNGTALQMINSGGLFQMALPAFGWARLSA